MEKIDFSKYKIPEQKEGRIYAPWQVYAAEIIKQFGIKKATKKVIGNDGKERNFTTNYPAMIFKHCCNDQESGMSWVKGKVENAKERFKGEDLTTKGNYLISLFRCKKPWDKK
jgi:hypothetical protein